MYVCVCMYVYVCMCMYVYVCMYVCVCMYVYVCMYVSPVRADNGIGDWLLTTEGLPWLIHIF